ncbi:hypothetical protein KCP75_21900 [Salmonella enterica subsp. enterica]|nr:hypothetical protein KCP75_21900 [Salmonella enterica subsp. enterica]
MRKAVRKISRCGKTAKRAHPSGAYIKARPVGAQPTPPQRERWCDIINRDGCLGSYMNEQYSALRSSPSVCSARCWRNHQGCWENTF